MEHVKREKSRATEMCTGVVYIVTLLYALYCT